MGKVKVTGSVELKYETLTKEAYTLNKTTQDNKKIQVSWTIPHFMTLLTDIDIAELHSPQLMFKFVTHFARENNLVKIYYKSCGSSAEQIFMKSIELKTYTFDEDRWEFEEESIAKEEHVIIPGEEWQLLTSLTIKDCSLLKGNKKILFLQNQSLHLRFEFVMTTIESKIAPTFPIAEPQLSDDLENILNEGTYSDVVMKSADGDEFKAHKALLASRSAVLKANFDHNFTESATNIVESPLETAVLREMLLFIYTDRVKVDEMPEKLLVAADYYQLSRLKSLCEESLHKRLTVDNAVETLQLADSHSAGILAELTLQYIKQDHERLKLITKTEGWTKLNSVDLIKRIFE